MQIVKYVVNFMLCCGLATFSLCVNADVALAKLNGYNPSIQDDADLVSFDQIIGDATIVGLGESTHGTSEFFQMKHRLLQHLVKKSGFTVLAMEESMATAALLNNYVLNSVGDPNTILKTMSPQFATSEVADVIHWMHDYNLTAKNKIEFVGFDMQDQIPAANNISSLLANTHIKVIKDESVTFSDSVKQLDQDITGITSDISATKQTTQQLNDINTLDSKEKQFKVTLDQFRNDLVANKDALVVELGSSSYDWLLQNLRIIEQYNLLMTAELRESVPSLKRTTDSTNLRDSFMAENILWLHSHYSNAKIVLWSHALHMQTTRAFGVGVSNLAGYVWVTTGTHLKQTLKDQYRAINLLTFAGTYTAFDAVSNKLGLYTLQVPPSNSLEAHLNVLCPEVALIDLRDKSKLPDFLWQPMQVRAIGVASMDAQFVQQGNVSAAFDGLIYIRDTTGSKSLM